MCISSLGFSLYCNVRQTNAEERLRHLRHLDDRITTIELKLEHSFQQLFTGNLNMRNNHQHAELRQHPETDSAELAGENNNNNNNNDDMSHEAVRRLSLLQMSDLHRLRRDVSQLKLARRQQRRQTLGGASTEHQPTECSCTAGMCAYL